MQATVRNTGTAAEKFLAEWLIFGPPTTNYQNSTTSIGYIMQGTGQTSQIQQIINPGQEFTVMMGWKVAADSPAGSYSVTLTFTVATCLITRLVIYLQLPAKASFSKSTRAIPMSKLTHSLGFKAEHIHVAKQDLDAPINNWISIYLFYDCRRHINAI